jgi:Na+-translocating ferredoxin:NAD+ oxidoreductase subunit D
MRFRTHSSPHMTPAHDVGRVMRRVLYALVPGTLAMTWYFGWGVLVNVMLAVIFAVGFEALMLRLRRRPVIPTLGDYSAVVTGWLFALALPPLTPWWVTLVGIGFRHGGRQASLRRSRLQPLQSRHGRLRGGAAVLPPGDDPVAAAHGPARRGLASVSCEVLGRSPGSAAPGLTWDAITTATPLDLMKTELSLNRTISEIREHPLFGDFSGKGWEWIGNWFLLGGLWLLFMRVISWHIPVAVLGSLAVTAGVFWILDPDAYASPAFHVFSGAAILGAFFIATDPVSPAPHPGAGWSTARASGC